MPEVKPGKNKEKINKNKRVRKTTISQQQEQKKT